MWTALTLLEWPHTSKSFGADNMFGDTCGRWRAMSVGSFVFEIDTGGIGEGEVVNNTWHGGRALALE